MDQASSTLGPTNDIIFKLLFGSEKRKRVLISLLTSILKPSRPIVDVTIKNPIGELTDLNDKTIVMDVLVKLDDESLVDVEMQARRTHAFNNRVMYYSSRTFGQQLVRGGQYDTLKPVAIIVIADYVEPKVPRLLSTYTMREEHTGERFDSVLAVHMVQLPRIYGPLAPDEKADASLQRWAKFLGTKSESERAKVAKEDEVIAEARAVLDELLANEEVRRLAYERETQAVCYAIEVGGAHAAGKAEGMAVGKEEGRAEGEAKGKAVTLLRQITKRFGPLAEETTARIFAASIEQLERGADAILDAQSLDDVLDAAFAR